MRLMIVKTSASIQYGTAPKLFYISPHKNSLYAWRLLRWESQMLPHIIPTWKSLFSTRVDLDPFKRDKNICSFSAPDYNQLVHLQPMHRPPIRP